MRGLTHKIGSSCADKYSKREKPVIKRILISRPNDRLGNLLLITPLIQELMVICPDCKIDLFVRGNLAPIVFKNYPNVDRIIRLPKKPFKQLPRYLYTWFHLRGKKYDLVANVVKTSSSGRLSVFFASSRIKFFGDDSHDMLQLPGHSHMGKYPVYNLRLFLKKLGYEVAERQVPLLDIKLSPDELAGGQKQLDAIIPNPAAKTICVFTNASGGKKFSESWWEIFYEKLEQNFPDYNIVEALPVENTSQISFKAPSYYTKDVRELGAFIAACDIFIGADSGVMHLASASGTTTVGLFSVTNAASYGPYGNGSACIDTTTGTPDDWIEVVKEAMIQA